MMQRKATEPSDLDPLASRERRGHLIKYGLYRQLDILLVKLAPFSCDVFDQL